MTVKLAFIGAGSTIFMKNIVGDMLHFPALRDARISLMDIDPQRLEESRMVAEKMIATMGTGATVEATTDRARALDGADFVRDGLPDRGLSPLDRDRISTSPGNTGCAKTIADTLGVGGIMRGSAHRAASVGRGRGHGAALPRCDASAIREPHGDQHHGAGGAFSPTEAGGPVPFRAKHGRGNRPRP